MRPSTEEKKRRILRAARMCLSRKGFASTTIGEVATEAGVSRGLLHYHFVSKEAMLAEVARDSGKLGSRLARELLRGCAPDQDVARELTLGFRRFIEAYPDYYHVFFESWAVARQSGVVAAAMNTVYEDFRNALRDGLADAVARGVVRPALPVPELSVLLTSILDGLGLQLTTQPELATNEGVWRATEIGIRCALGSG